jgi:purine/pyrimidine-nucleoside phosphorylase
VLMAVKHNVYFDGSVQSLGLPTAKARATVGVIEPGEFEFSTDDEEHVHVIEGTFRIQLGPDAEWTEFKPGEVCVIPSGITFHVGPREHVAYICYYFPRAPRGS